MKARKFLAGILTGIIALTLWATPAFAGGGIAFNEFTCSSLTIPPVIPSNVEYMDCIFESCNSLSGILVCNANPTNYRYALEGTKILAVDGSCSNEIKYKLLKTVDEM